MANMPGFDQAIMLARDNPGLGVGLHLNLLRGEPVSRAGQVPTLLGRDGRFLDRASSFLIRLLSGRISEGEVERELRGQIEKALNAGLRITHFDSEKHLHSFPPVFKVALKLAVEYRVGGIRRISEPVYRQLSGPKYLLAPQLYKTILLNGLHSCMADRIDRSGIRHADCFYGVLYSGRMDSRKYDTIFGDIQDGVTEIMCHPGYLASAGEISKGANYYINRFREIELNGLLDQSLKGRAKMLGIKFINYGDIN